MKMWKDYVKEQIKNEDARIEFRAKLRNQIICDHMPSLTSDCAYCRKLYWEKHLAKCCKKERPTIGMINCPKSE